MLPSCWKSVPQGYEGQILFLIITITAINSIILDIRSLLANVPFAFPHWGAV
jgi:hypothetical protein